LLFTPIESAPSPGEAAVPDAVRLINGSTELIWHELLLVVSVWVVEPSEKLRPLLPRCRWTAVGAAPPLDSATSPSAPVARSAAATARIGLFLNIAVSLPPENGWPPRAEVQLDLGATLDESGI